MMKLFVICLSMLLMVPASALAEDPAPPSCPLPFSTFDQDGDGWISAAEFDATHEQRKSDGQACKCKMCQASGMPEFSEFDADADGRMSEEELNTGREARMSKHSEHQGHGKQKGHGKHQGHGHGDGNEMHSGQKHGGKMKGKHMPAFEDFDTDGDGAMSEAELMAGHAKHMSERAAAGGKMKHAGEGPSFTRIDSDGNGEISPEEFAAHQTERHSEMKAADK